MPSALLGGNQNPRWANDALTQPVTGLIDLDDHARVRALNGPLGHRLVLGRVEGVARGPEGLDADTTQRRAQLCPHEAHALQQRIILRRRLERAVEIVERREQLLRELYHPALLSGRGLARNPLTVVLEVGLGALSKGQIVIALSGQIDQLV